MAARSQKGSEKPLQRLSGSLPASSRDRLLAAEVRRGEAEAARAELEVAKLAGEIARHPLEEQLLEVEVAEGRAEVELRRSQTKANAFSDLRDKTLLIVFLLMVILFLALAIIDLSMLKMLGGGAALLGGLGLLGRR